MPVVDLHDDQRLHVTAENGDSYWLTRYGVCCTKHGFAAMDTCTCSDEDVDALWMLEADASPDHPSRRRPSPSTPQDIMRQSLRETGASDEVVAAFEEALTHPLPVPRGRRMFRRRQEGS